jgi:predicted membrane-bound dolichyl-phosphate-mannose-protein mannosyltransferase
MTKKQKFLAAIFLFTLTVVIRVPVLRSVGETWDEYTVVNPGETYISAIKNLDFSESSWIQNYEHPPIAKYLYGLSRTISRHSSAILRWDSEYRVDKEYTVPRLLSACFGGLTVVLVFLIGLALFSPVVGAVSSIILAIYPSFVAYTSIVSLESVYVFFTTLFIYFLIKALKTSHWVYHLSAILALSLCFATRYNGLFFVLLYLVTILFRYKREILRLEIKKLPWSVVASPAIFIGTIYLIWPWLWLSPVNLFDSIMRSSGGHSGEYFLGSLAQPGWYYYFVYFLVTTPEVLLILFGLFVIRTIKKLELRKLSSIKRPISFLISSFYTTDFLTIWFLTPFLASGFAFKQNGIRYVVAFIPPLAIICGYCLVWLISRFKSKLFKVILLGTALVGLLYPLVWTSPYFLDYYNLLSGGPATAYKNKAFVVGWWGEGGLDAVRYINANAPNNAVVRMLFSPRHTLINFRKDIRQEQNFVLGNKDDFILLNTYNEWYGDQKMLSDLDQYRLVYEVKTSSWGLLDAPLVKVYKRQRVL